MKSNSLLMTLSCFCNSSADGFSLSLICLAMHLSVDCKKLLPASISYWASPITIRFVMASRSSRPSICHRERKAYFFQSQMSYEYSNSPRAEITGMYFIIIWWTFGRRMLEEYSTQPFLAFVMISTLAELRNFSRRATTCSWTASSFFLCFWANDSIWFSSAGSKNVVGSRVSS